MGEATGSPARRGRRARGRRRPRRDQGRSRRARDRRHLLRGRRHRRRNGARRGCCGGGAGAAAHMHSLRGRRLGRADDRPQRQPARSRPVPQDHRDQSHRHVQRAAARGVGDGGQRARRRRRARRDRQHRVGRRVRRADRPGRVLGVEGRRRVAHAHRRPRPLGGRYPRVHDRARAHRHAAARHAPRRSAPRSPSRCCSRSASAPPTTSRRWRSSSCATTT